jgi:hypothetical protein
MRLAASRKRWSRDRFGYLKWCLTWILRLTLTASTIMARSLPLPRPCGSYNWKTQYRFTLQPYEYSDYEEMRRYQLIEWRIT